MTRGMTSLYLCHDYWLEASSSFYLQRRLYKGGAGLSPVSPLDRKEIKPVNPKINQP